MSFLFTWVFDSSGGTRLLPEEVVTACPRFPVPQHPLIPVYLLLYSVDLHVYDIRVLLRLVGLSFVPSYAGVRSNRVILCTIL